MLARPNQVHSLGTLACELIETEGPCRSGKRGGTSGILPSPAPAATSGRSNPSPGGPLVSAAHSLLPAARQLLWLQCSEAGPGLRDRLPSPGGLPRRIWPSVALTAIPLSPPSGLTEAVGLLCQGRSRLQGGGRGEVPGL